MILIYENISSTLSGKKKKREISTTKLISKQLSKTRSTQGSYIIPFLRQRGINNSLTKVKSSFEYAYQLGILFIIVSRPMNIDLAKKKKKQIPLY